MSRHAVHLRQRAKGIATAIGCAVPRTWSDAYRVASVLSVLLRELRHWW